MLRNMQKENEVNSHAILNKKVFCSVWHEAPSKYFARNFAPLNSA